MPYKETHTDAHILIQFSSLDSLHFHIIRTKWIKLSDDNNFSSFFVIFFSLSVFLLLEFSGFLFNSKQKSCYTINCAFSPPVYITPLSILHGLLIGIINCKSLFRLFYSLTVFHSCFVPPFFFSFRYMSFTLSLLLSLCLSLSLSF